MSWAFGGFPGGGQHNEDEQLRALNVPRPIGYVSRAWAPDLRARAFVALLQDDRQQAVLNVEGVDDSFMRDSMSWSATVDDMEVSYAVLGLGGLADDKSEATRAHVPAAMLLAKPWSFAALLGYIEHEMLLAPSSGISTGHVFSKGAPEFERWSNVAFGVFPNPDHGPLILYILTIYSPVTTYQDTGEYAT